MDEYRPMMSAERAACLREWQERAYRRGRRARQDVTYLGCELVIPPGVMPITPVSNLLGQAVLNEVGAGERVLDMGTGSGVNAILAASQGASVLAVDINPDAVTTARNNVRRNGFEDLVEVRESDVFGVVEGAFDVAGRVRSANSPRRRSVRSGSPPPLDVVLQAFRAGGAVPGKQPTGRPRWRRKSAWRRSATRPVCGGPIRATAWTR